MRESIAQSQILLEFPSWTRVSELYQLGWRSFLFAASADPVIVKSDGGWLLHLLSDLTHLCPSGSEAPKSNAGFRAQLRLYPEAGGGDPLDWPEGPPVLAEAGKQSRFDRFRLPGAILDSSLDCLG